MENVNPNTLTYGQRNKLIDYLQATLDPLEPSYVFKPEMGVLGPVKRVVKVPEPSRAPTPPTPLRLPEPEKEPVKVA